MSQLSKYIDKTITVITASQLYGATSIENYTFQNCSSLTSITIPNSVTNIGDSAFNDCSSLTSITIPDSVTNIGRYAFQNCSSLTSITIPNSVASIEKQTFQKCSSLTSITIPDSVTNIGDSAFNDCSSLTSITIPDSVTNIDKIAFGGTTTSSSKRLRINFLSSTPATVYAYCPLQGGTFTQSKSSTIIYADVHIPVGTEASYRANTVWNTFFNSSNVTVTADL